MNQNEKWMASNSCFAKLITVYYNAQTLYNLRLQLVVIHSPRKLALTPWFTVWVKDTGKCLCQRDGVAIIVNPIASGKNTQKRWIINNTLFIFSQIYLFIFLSKAASDLSGSNLRFEGSSAWMFFFFFLLWMLRNSKQNLK